MTREFLDDEQERAVKELAQKMQHDIRGCVLVGEVGSGKTRTAIAYYYTQVCGGKLCEPGSMTQPKSLYVITTAATRDKGGWDQELINFHLGVGGVERNPKICQVPIVIDSWNNIEKYIDVKDAFFIFDEQRLVSYGKWSKSFIKIARNNEWILLSATPGEVWNDYAVVFIANGFYKNITDFRRQHIIYNEFVNYPQIKDYMNVKKLIFYKKAISVVMQKDPDRAVHKDQVIICNYDSKAVAEVTNTGINPYTKEVIEDGAGYFRVWRQLINSDPSRVEAIAKIMVEHPKVIIFYNFNYELDILKDFCYYNRLPYTEWNGQKHEPLPKSENSWCYLVQYNAGAEGWNCTETDTVIFYSQNYSYKVTKQAAGRIDRRNTPFKVLYYYTLISHSKVDSLIGLALKKKKNFSENRYFKEIKDHYSQ